MIVYSTLYLVEEYVSTNHLQLLQIIVYIYIYIYLLYDKLFSLINKC